MANMELEAKFNVAFTHRELTIVTLALQGKLKSQDQKQVALQISERLVEERARVVGDYKKVVDGATERFREQNPKG